MPWVRLDDRFPSSRKIRLLSDGAFRLYVSAICWASENLTDGVIKTAELRLVADVKSSRTRAKELVEAGLWEIVQGVGWRIHDYLDYNPSAEQVRAERKAKTARQQRWRAKKQGGAPNPEPPARKAHVDASTDASQDASRDGAGDAAPRARVPVPSRPVPNPIPVADVEGEGAGSGTPEAERPEGRPPFNAPIDDDGFTLTDAMRRWALQTFGPGLDIDHETALFVDHHRAQGTRRPNWAAEWQKWIRRSAKWASERRTRASTEGPRPTNVVALPTAQPRPSTADQRAGAAFALAAELRAQEGHDPS